MLYQTPIYLFSLFVTFHSLSAQSPSPQSCVFSESACSCRRRIEADGGCVPEDSVSFQDAATSRCNGRVICGRTWKCDCFDATDMCTRSKCTRWVKEFPDSDTCVPDNTLVDCIVRVTPSPSPSPTPPVTGLDPSFGDSSEQQPSSTPSPSLTPSETPVFAMSPSPPFELPEETLSASPSNSPSQSPTPLHSPSSPPSPSPSPSPSPYISPSQSSSPSPSLSQSSSISPSHSPFLSQSVSPSLSPSFSPSPSPSLFPSQSPPQSSSPSPEISALQSSSPSSSLSQSPTPSPSPTPTISASMSSTPRVECVTSDVCAISERCVLGSCRAPGECDDMLVAYCEALEPGSVCCDVSTRCVVDHLEQLYTVCASRCDTLCTTQGERIQCVFDEHQVGILDGGRADPCPAVVSVNSP